MTDSDPLDEAWRRDGTRVLAVLAQRFGDLDVAEEALAEALSLAAERWRDGAPNNSAGWLYRVAYNKALDAGRYASRSVALSEQTIAAEPDFAEPDAAMSNAELGLYFLCAHPSLSADSQAMLMLRLCAGLPVERVAAAFTVDPQTVTRRLSRAKAKIKAAKLPLETPPPSTWQDRLAPVLATIEIIYDQHYADIGGGTETQALAREAEDLATALASALPDEPEVLGLLALVNLTESRRPARIDQDGAMIPLPEQDVRLWDRPRIETAARLLERAANLRSPGPYQIRAMIHALHAHRLREAETPWADILDLYDALLALHASPHVRVNRAVALAEIDGAEAALQEVEAALIATPKLSTWQPFHAVRANLLAKLGQTEAAKAAFQGAIVGCNGTAERRYLIRRAAQLT